MELEDIEEENKKFLKKALKEEQKQKSGEGSKNELLSPDSGQPRLEHRRGSHLLAAAGIGFEKRHKQPSGGETGESRIFQEGGQWLEEKDGKITKLEVIGVKEKMGNMRKSVPTLPIFLAIILCLLNVILPGIGTFIGASTLLCCGKCRHEAPSTGIKFGVLAGFLQVLLTPLLVGWIFSIYYGVNIVQDSLSNAANKTEEITSTGAEGGGGGGEEDAASREDESGNLRPPPDTHKNQAWV